MSELDEIREQQRRTWDRFSAGWTSWDALVVRWLEPVGVELIGSLALRADSQHLDIAAGTGEPGLSIAALVPRGRVVLTDLSAGMLESARANVSARGLSNVELRECGVDHLPFADESFDSISCRFGFMFFPDIAAAVTEMLRVLRPGGRIATAVWAEPAGNPWASIPMSAISSEIGPAESVPDAPGLFRCAAVGAVAEVFGAAGMCEVAETDVRGALETDDVEEYWSFITEVAAPVVSRLAEADEAARGRIRESSLAEARAFQVGTRVRLPMHARCISGTK
jgi:SAM-dependent methyltransferase